MRSINGWHLPAVVMAKQPSAIKNLIASLAFTTTPGKAQNRATCHPTLSSLHRHQKIYRTDRNYLTTKHKINVKEFKFTPFGCVLRCVPSRAQSSKVIETNYKYVLRPVLRQVKRMQQIRWKGGALHCFALRCIAF